MSWAKTLDILEHVWIPIVVLATGGAAGLIRVMRANMLDELGKPYVETASAQGLSERQVVWGYPVRVALNPFISTVGWALPALLTALKSEDYVMAARLTGASEYRVITKHMLSAMTLAVPEMILGETALSFLGLGLRPPVVSWGVLLQDAQNLRSVSLAPWLLMPGVAVVAVVMGFTVFQSAAQSASCKFEIAPKADAVIEYAIWYDWDIQHLYDLEHVWVHIDAAGAVVAVEASFHGRKVPMDLVGGVPKLEGDRPVLYAEPGKHAHWVDGHAMALHAGDKITQMCGEEAGKEAVHRGNPFFADGRYGTTPFADRLARLKMKRDAFVPRFAFDRSSDDADVVLTDRPTLVAWIPQRVDHLVAHLPVQVPHLGAVFLDCGARIGGRGICVAPCCGWSAGDV